MGFFATLSAFAFAFAAASAPGPGEPLGRDARVTRVLEAGAPQVFSVELRAGDYFHVVVLDQGIASAVRLLDAEGRELARAAADEDGRAPRLSLVAASAGVLRLELSRAQGNARSCELRTIGPRPATAADGKQIEGERAVAMGDALKLKEGKAQLQESIVQYQRAVALFQEASAAAEEADAIGRVGDSHYLLGDLPAMRDDFERSLAVAKASGDLRAQAGAMTNLGGALAALGESLQALEVLGPALALCREAGDSVDEAMVLTNRANALVQLGQRGQAIALLSQVIELERLTGDRKREGQALAFRALDMRSQGEPERAVDDLERALAIDLSESNLRGGALTRLSLASTLLDLGETARARKLIEESLVIFRQVGDQYFEAVAVEKLGTAALQSGEPAKALELFGQVMEIPQRVGSRFWKHRLLALRGQAEMLLGHREKARALLTESLTQTRAVQFWVRAAEVLADLARLDLLEGDSSAALAHVEEAVHLAESHRATIVGAMPRAQFLSTKRRTWQLLVAVQMALHRAHPEQGWDRKALASDERARARSLLEQLGESRADIREGVDPALLARERAASLQLERKGQEQLRLLGKEHAASAAGSLARQIQVLAAEYQALEAELRTKSPRYAALTLPEPIGVEQIQREIVDEGTLLLQISLGEEHSFLWVLSSTELHTFELPAGAKIEGAARAVYQDFSSEGAVADGEAARRAQALSSMVLGPAAELLSDKRLLLVLDGALQYVPFAALPEPRVRGSRRRRLLLEGHEIANLPSASTLAVLRRELAGRPRPGRTIAVLADPVFEARDPRVSGAEPAHKGQALAAESLVRPGRDAAVTFERLPATRREAAAIAALAGEGALVALDFQASRATAMSPALADFRFVHFASHGVLDSRHPALSGIVLSLVDEQGAPQDGFLQTHDVYNLRLSADLVVLSGCQTALGQQIWGEGIVGLVRGFMYAGAARVMASLWKVPDRATSELMQRFYRGVLAEGLSPTAALRKAQLSMSRQRRFTAHDWAGFSLQGEWK